MNGIMVKSKQVKRITKAVEYDITKAINLSIDLLKCGNDEARADGLKFWFAADSYCNFEVYRTGAEFVAIPDLYAGEGAGFPGTEGNWYVLTDDGEIERECI